VPCSFQSDSALGLGSDCFDSSPVRWLYESHKCGEQVAMIGGRRPSCGTIFTGRQTKFLRGATF
jgi:hypothetical protein